MALFTNIGMWCNGNTTDFDSVVTGSTPVIPVRAASEEPPGRFSFMGAMVKGFDKSGFLLEIIDGRELPEYMTMNKGKICG